MKQGQSQAVVVHVHTEKSKRRRRSKAIKQSSKSTQQTGINPASTFFGSFNTPAQHHGQFYMGAQRVMPEYFNPLNRQVVDRIGGVEMQMPCIEPARPVLTPLQITPPVNTFRDHIASLPARPVFRAQLREIPETPQEVLHFRPEDAVWIQANTSNQEPYHHVRPALQQEAHSKTSAPAKLSAEEVGHFTDRVMPLKSLRDQYQTPYEGLDELEPRVLTQDEQALVDEYDKTAPRLGRPKGAHDILPRVRTPMQTRRQTAGLNVVRTLNL